MSAVEQLTTREVTEIVGECAAEFTFKITPAARVTKEWIRATFAVEAENIIAVLRERAPQVLVP